MKVKISSKYNPIYLLITRSLKISTFNESINSIKSVRNLIKNTASNINANVICSSNSGCEKSIKHFQK